MDEQGEGAADCDDVLEGLSFERMPLFDSKAPYDLYARESRIDSITAMGKAIAQHLLARLGSAPKEPALLMQRVWESLNNRDWLGLSKEEASILLMQLHFLLAASIL